tara:strand:+ start:19138 stop:20736 length:1599 start_codon:yes stop_codon:yes gene_type:complete
MPQDFQPLSAALGILLQEISFSAWISSPGSRNAPLLHAFSSLKCPNAVILDERSAGYFALGTSIRSGKPVILVCTSGTAALNYAPSVAEAFYQRVPLLVITADRPKNLIDNGHGQSIRQENIYEGHLRASSILNPEKPIQYNVDKIRDSLSLLKDGPVHINVPIKEPLYEASISLNISSFERISKVKVVNKEFLKIPDWILKARYPVLIVGQWNPEWGKIDDIVANFRFKGWLVLAEHLSQLSALKAINLDDVLIDNTQIPFDAVVTVGGAWISKKSKNRLNGIQHMHIGPSSPHPDMFGNLKFTLETAHKKGLKYLFDSIPDLDAAWLKNWSPRFYKKTAQWSDLWVNEKISKYGLKNWDIHWANSSSVRYGIHSWSSGGWNQKGQTHYSNRGTSGIDGCTSTAVGSAWISGKRTLLITGDLAFFYDSNAFLNNHVSLGFKVVVLNNHGGDIFRRLPKAIDSDIFETHLSYKHNRSIKNLVSYTGLEYFYVSKIDHWEIVWKKFIESPNSSVLEVITDSSTNDKMWNNRFK